LNTNCGALFPGARSIAIKSASLIDEIELDFWSGQKSEKANKLETMLRSIIEKEKDPQKIIEKSMAYIDSIVDSL